MPACAGMTRGRRSESLCFGRLVSHHPVSAAAIRQGTEAPAVAQGVDSTRRLRLRP